MPKLEETGSISLFGTDPILHRAFAEHITSEAWSPEKQRYERVPGFAHNHWLDCMAGCCAGAGVLGIRLIQPLPPRRVPQAQSEPWVEIITMPGVSPIRTHY
ncbi:MAG: hypothetical protein GX455_12250 [Phycisphaerae bacterium]|nr:hypothetical protein [Phycisphaerae bacterium]